MTELEWLTSDSPQTMLAKVIRHGVPRRASEPGGAADWASERKLRLFTVAALRYLLSRGDPPATVHQRAAILELERFADDGDETGLFETWQDANLPRPGIALATNAAARMHAQMMTEYPMKDMRAFCCNALRCVVGNPFRPVALPRTELCPVCDGLGGWASSSGRRGSPGGQTVTPCARCDGEGRLCPWLSDTVLSLARAAYEERNDDGSLDPVRLAILADALEEAGCNDLSLLGHLRGEWSCWGAGAIAEKQKPIIHVRGCWAVDLVLCRV